MMNSPRVTLIGYTRFPVEFDDDTDTIDCIPSELLENNDDDLQILELNQFQGSDQAKIIEIAGRTCYDSFGKGRDSKSYHENILEVGHGSVVEHITLNFSVFGVSRNLTHELVRYRAGTAFSQRSTRYVDESSSEMCFNPHLQNLIKNDDHIDVAIMNHIKESMGLYMIINNRVYEDMRNKGIDTHTARKIARGAARDILPGSLETGLILTFNIRSLRHFIETRANDFADCHIRLLANKLWEIAVELIPEYFLDYEKADALDGIGYILTTKHKKV